MSEVKVPKLNRKAREEDTREKTTQRKPWTPPSRLDAPPAPAGYKHRWIRAEAAGIEDRINVSGKIREGYELVRSDEYPDFPIPTVEDGRYAGIISVGGMLLARIPEEIADQRNTYYSRKAQNQMDAVDNDWMKDNNPAMPKLNPQRKSSVSFGSRKIKQE